MAQGGDERTVGLLFGYACEVVEQALQGFGFEGFAGVVRGLGDGFAGAGAAEQVQAKGVRQAGGEVVEIGREGRQVIFADGEQRPVAGIFQGRAELAEEFVLAGLVQRIEGEDFLELVESRPG